MLDAQSIKTSANVPAAGQGIDAGKKIAGRKRHLGVDTLGLLLAVLVRTLIPHASSKASSKRSYASFGRRAASHGRESAVRGG